ncbi:MAG: radical SAM protein, partial [bacterium]|nr:radical SAM protein [bacterium]
MKNIYTRLKVFHFKEKLDSLSEGEGAIQAPVHIRVKPTNACNHNCYYCAYRCDNLQLGIDMGTKDFIIEAKMMELIEDWVEMGVKAVTFSGGGDPFCYPYLLKAVKRLSQTPIRFATLTNGSRLKGELAEVFAAHGTWLRISVDGWDDASYSSYRRVPEGEFSKLMGNMADFKKLAGDC